MVFYEYVPIVLVFFVAFYIYKFVNRVIDSSKIKNKKIFTMLVTAIIVIPSINVWGLWALILFSFVLLSLIMDLINIIIVKKKIKNKTYSYIYHYGFIPLFLIFVFTIYGLINASTVIKTEYNFKSNKELSSDYKIVYLSDLHFGTNMGVYRLKEVVDKINKNNPDIVILGGDIVDENTSNEEMQEAFRELGKIKNKYGVYYQYGNHDRQQYKKNKVFTVKEMEDTMILNGINLLEDSKAIINNELTIIGRRDYSEKNRDNINELLQGVDKNDYILMLDHQPKDVILNSNKNIDLMISGHTHAGQIWPLDLVVKTISEVGISYGYKKVGNMDFIISSGISVWKYPIRTEKHCEYLIISINK